ncbi:MAG TPA: outer membrane beta-barrel family protein, partial [Nitrosopumilaceae archaeon]|nr:outer membrane beta-barrel family protein [Nitrosopumilaceae archaeon]
IFNYNYPQENYVKDSLLSNSYIIDEMVNAAYINYSSKFKGIGYMGGLRFEQSYYKGNITDKNTSFFYNYPSSPDNLLKSIFPAIYLSKKLPKNQEVQLNFSRKINRPNFMQLMPFIMFSDKQNYRIGNPQLTPEFLNIAEANYNIVIGKVNFLSSGYFRYTETPITSISYTSPKDSTVLVNTSVNGKNSYIYGWDNTLKLTLFKNLDITANANVFYTIITSTSQFNNASNKGYSWFGKMVASYKFPKDFTLQMNGSYQAPQIIPQGTANAIYFMDISLNKMIYKKMILNLSLSDVFNTKRMGTHYDTPQYLQDISRRREARYLKFTFTYMFGKMDASIFKRKPQKGG